MLQIQIRPRKPSELEVWGALFHSAGPLVAQRSDGHCLIGQGIMAMHFEPLERSLSVIKIYGNLGIMRGASKLGWLAFEVRLPVLGCCLLSVTENRRQTLTLCCHF